MTSIYQDSQCESNKNFNFGNDNQINKENINAELNRQNRSFLKSKP